MTAREANEQLMYETTSGAGGGLAATMETAKETCERLQDKTVKAAKAADHVIRGHAYESMGVAFGLGLLIGVLVGRR